jgi:FKBP-type peptidyl-prolyl cis-trans isomerase (trigger factor)
LPPEIKLGDYRSIRVPAPELEDPSDEDVDEIFDRLRRDMASMESMERAAEADDLVKIKMEARREDGGIKDESAEDSSAESGEESGDVSTADADADAGTGEEADSGPAAEAADPGLVRSHDEMYVPLNEEGARQAGLPEAVTDELIGLSAGDTASFTVAYPDDWYDEALQGVPVVFNVEVKEVSEIILPELDDAFAVSVSDVPTLEELRARVRTDLQMRQRSEMRDQHVESVVDALVAVASVAFPPAMLESEVQDLVRDLRDRVERQGFTWERWLKMQGKEDEQLWAEFEAQAASRLTRGLVLGEFIEAEGIDLEATEIQAEMERIDSMLGKVPKKKRPDKQALLRQTGNRILTGRAIARLMAIATGEADETEEANFDAETAPDSPPDSDASSDAEAASEAEASLESED